MKLVVLGAGGHAKVVIEAARAMGLNPVAAFDDDPNKWRTEIVGVKVLGPIEKAHVFQDASFVIAVGSNSARRTVSALPVIWATIIHPAAWVSPTAEIEDGCVIFAGAIVQADTEIGRHSIINTSASVDHDCQIGSYSHIAPGARLAGNVATGEEAFIGAGAVVIPGISIGERAVIGAGAVVIEDVPAGSTVVGVPARVIRTSN